jgi:hypothetical protein
LIDENELGARETAPAFGSHADEKEEEAVNVFKNPSEKDEE